MQAQMDGWWAALLRNDPEVILSVLAEAFADNEAPAAAVGVEGAEVALVVLVPPIDAIPERKPDLTPAGNLTIKKLTKAERGAFHATAVASHVLLTVKEAFAVAPAVSASRVIALQHSGNDAFGRPKVDVLVAARFERERLRQVLWNQASALAILGDASTELIATESKTSSTLRPINLAKEPDIAKLLQHLDLNDLVTHG